VIAIAWLTRWRVDLATFSGVWIARLTVAIETSARRATSSIVAGVMFDTGGAPLSLRNRSRHYRRRLGGESRPGGGHPHISNDV